METTERGRDPCALPAIIVHFLLVAFVVLYGFPAKPPALARKIKSTPEDPRLGLPRRRLLLR